MKIKLLSVLAATGVHGADWWSQQGGDNINNMLDEAKANADAATRNFNLGDITDKIKDSLEEIDDKISNSDFLKNLETMTTSALDKLSEVQWEQIDFGTIKGWTQDKVQKIPDYRIELMTSAELDKFDLDKLSSDQFSHVNKEWVMGHLDKLSDAVTRMLTPEQTKDVSPQTVMKLRQSQWENMDLSMSENWSNDAIAAMPVRDFSEELLRAIPVSRITDLALEQLKSIPWMRIGRLTEEQWEKIPVDKFAELGWEQLQQAPLEKWAEAGLDVLDNLEVGKLIRMTGEQIAEIKPAVIAKLAKEYWDKVPVYQLVHMTASQLTEIGVENLDADKLAKLSKDQWTGVPFADIVKFTGEQLQKVDYDKLANMAQNMWDKIKFSEIKVGIVGEKIRAIPAATVGEWTKEMWAEFPIKEMVMFKGWQLNNAATLAKLTIDALAEYAKSGELDMDLLSEEVKAQLKARIEETGKTLQEYKEEGGKIAEWIEKLAGLKAATQKARAKLGALKNKLDSEPSQIEAAETELDTAIEEEYVTAEKLVAVGYMEESELVLPKSAENSAPRAAPAFLAFVLATALAVVLA